MKKIYWIVLACLSMALTSCAYMTVSRVDLDAEKPVSGLRYSLPKPFIQVVPQADGTVNVSVVYLPDSKNTYAIDTTSFMSSYAFQVSLDQNGLLNAVEFKQNTSAVGQQAAATSGAVTAQVLNMRNAQAVAAQTAVNTAQSTVDTARAARDAAQAKYDTLKANMPENSSDVVNALVALKQTEAQLASAQQVLDRARNTSQAVSTTASTGTPVTTSAIAPSATGFGAPTWTALPSYNIYGSRGAVLYAVNDYMEKGKNQVSLNAVKGYPDEAVSQKRFDTLDIAAGPPTLGPQHIGYPPGTDKAIFKFSQDVIDLYGQSLLQAGKSVNDGAHAAELDKGDLRTVTLPLKGLSKGDYTLLLQYHFRNKTTIGWADVTFTVN